MNKIIMAHGASNLISKFNTIFLGIYFLKLTDGNLRNVILFYLVQYICTPIFSYIVCRIINGRNLVKIYRLGILLNSLTFVVLFLMGENIVGYIFIFAVIQNFVGMLYWEPYKNLIYNFNGHDEYLKFNSYTNIVNNVISIFSMFGMGVIIFELSYVYLFLIIFIISFASFLVTFKFDIGDIKLKKFSNKELRGLVSDKQAKSIYKVVFYEGMGYCGALTTAIQLVIYLNTGAELDLGVLNGVFALFGIIAAIIVSRRLKREHYTLAYIVSATCILISIIPIILSTNMTYFIIYNIVFSIAYQVTSILMNGAVFNIKENEIINENRLEYTFLQESIHALGKIGGQLLLFIVAIYKYSLLNMQIVVAFLSLTILFQAIEYRKYAENSTK